MPHASCIPGLPGLPPPPPLGHRGRHRPPRPPALDPGGGWGRESGRRGDQQRPRNVEPLPSRGNPETDDLVTGHKEATFRPRGRGPARSAPASAPAPPGPPGARSLCLLRTWPGSGFRAAELGPRPTSTPALPGERARSRARPPQSTPRPAPGKPRKGRPGPGRCRCGWAQVGARGGGGGAARARPRPDPTRRRARPEPHEGLSCLAPHLCLRIRTCSN